MRFIGISITSCFILLAGLVPGQAQAADCQTWVAKAVSVQGTVEVRIADPVAGSKWQAIARGDTFCKNDIVRVKANSRAAIILSNDTILRLDQNSTITFSNLSADQASSMSISEGIAHFISRVKQSFEVVTPFVNAAIEGTEFVVEVRNKQSIITVMEGQVLARTEHGEVHLSSGQAAIVKKEQGPILKSRVKPHDAVQWALYYPAILDPQDGDAAINRVAALLSKGRVKEAQALLQPLLLQKDHQNHVDALALQSIIAVVNNDKTSAMHHAQQAVSLDEQNIVARLALSYAQQANFEVEQALVTLQQAVAIAPANSLVLARLAEVYLMNGDADQANAAAKQAIDNDPKSAKAHSVLGFTRLARFDTDQALHDFNQAITLDENDPLARLGLGLGLIRKGELEQGRREIEFAASLDPNNALIRSYLGKAYFEENRNKQAAAQFEMAKALDPLDPTPWFYSAIQKQTENRPVEALQDLRQSIELNDNRAVYRSRLLLDQDEAARNVSQAKIYNELGFEQTGLNEATKSLQQAPSNHSAHRFLADVYAKRHRHGIAHASELFQSQMLQPLSLNPIQAQDAETDLDIINVTDTLGGGYSEYSNLFTRNTTVANLNVFAGNQNTSGDNFIVSGLYDNYSISASQFRYKSDGFRENNDVEHEIYNIFLQSQLTNKLSVQTEYRNRNTNKGDVALKFDPADFRPKERNDIDTETGRLGFHYQPSTSEDILGSFIYRSEKSLRTIITEEFIPIPLIVNQTNSNDVYDTSRVVDLQHILQKVKYNITSGITYTDVNQSRFNTNRVVGISPPATIISDDTTSLSENFDRYHESIYSYLNYTVFDSLGINLGLSYDVFHDEVGENEIERINPKLGAQISLSDNTQLRLASFSTMNRPLPVSQTLEPTHVAGFNQFYDDEIGSKIIQHNLALDHSLNKNVNLGLEAIYRELDVPTFSKNKIFFDDLKELNHRLYLNWILSDIASLSISGIYEGFENVNKNTKTDANRIKTTHIPASLNFYLPGGFNASLSATYVDQDYVDAFNNVSHDSFTVTDLAMEYQFPARKGSFKIGVHNVFDEQFNFYDLNYAGETNEPRYQPARSYLAQLNYVF